MPNLNGVSLVPSTARKRGSFSNTLVTTVVMEGVSEFQGRSADVSWEINCLSFEPYVSLDAVLRQPH